MQKYIWLVPLLPLIGAAINGLLGRKLRFSEPLIGGIAVGSVALAFLISVAAVYSYGFGGHAEWPKPYVTSQDGFSFTWIPGRLGSRNQGPSEASLDRNTKESRRTVRGDDARRTSAASRHSGRRRG